MVVLTVYKRSNYKRARSFLFGMICAAMAMILAITIIGLLVAVPLALAAREHVRRAMGREYISCADCLARSTIKYTDKAYICEGCDQECGLRWKQAPSRSEYKRMRRENWWQWREHMKTLNDMEED